MKITVLRAVDYRVRPACVQAFKPGDVDVPRPTAEALIAQGAAIPAKTKPAKED